MPPEMVTLGVRIIRVCKADPKDLPRDGGVRRRIPQLNPITPPATRDDIVDRGQCKTSMVEMPVFHATDFIAKNSG